MVVRKPSALKLIAGEIRSIPAEEPRPETGIPDCPSENPAVREIWDYTIKQLGGMRVITMADRDMLLVYCQAVVTFRAATKILDEQGLIIEIGTEGKWGVLANPATKVRDSAAAQMRSYGTEFGLTPAARSRIRVSDQKPERKESGAARLLSG